jgi:hypothetical protein
MSDIQNKKKYTLSKKALEQRRINAKNNMKKSIAKSQVEYDSEDEVMYYEDDDGNAEIEQGIDLDSLVSRLESIEKLEKERESKEKEKVERKNKKKAEIEAKKSDIIREREQRKKEFERMKELTDKFDKDYSIRGMKREIVSASIESKKSIINNAGCNFGN